MTDWVKIKAEYLRGGTSLRELAEKYGVSPTTIQHRSAREKWADSKQLADSKRAEKIAERSATKDAKANDLFYSITEKLLHKIDEGIENGTLLASGRGMRDLTGALKDIREIRGIKSEADMREQEARINKLIKDTQEEKKDSTITVRLEGLEEYAD